MRFYRIEPEVGGGLGPRTVIDRGISPPRIKRLHYIFDGWLGDALLESFPCFIITERLKSKLEDMDPTGGEFAEVEVTKSPEFEELYPNQSLPQFFWLKITGNAGKDDFGLSQDNSLVVSERILNTMKNESLSHCHITEHR
jgi:hypothetical protein